MSSISCPAYTHRLLYSSLSADTFNPGTMADPLRIDTTTDQTLPSDTDGDSSHYAADHILNGNASPGAALTTNLDEDTAAVADNATATAGTDPASVHSDPVAAMSDADFQELTIAGLARSLERQTRQTTVSI